MISHLSTLVSLLSLLYHIILYSELEKVNKCYEAKLRGGSADAKTMFDLTWEIHDLEAVTAEGQSLYTAIAVVLDLCNSTVFQKENVPRKLSQLRKRVADMHQRVVRFKRVVATHMFVFMTNTQTDPIAEVDWPKPV